MAESSCCMFLLLINDNAAKASFGEPFRELADEYNTDFSLSNAKQVPLYLY
jgi:hypothetical protein